MPCWRYSHKFSTVTGFLQELTSTRNRERTEAGKGVQAPGPGKMTRGLKKSWLIWAPVSSQILGLKVSLGSDKWGWSGLLGTSHERFVNYPMSFGFLCGVFVKVTWRDFHVGKMTSCIIELMCKGGSKKKFLYSYCSKQVRNDWGLNWMLLAHRKDGQIQEIREKKNLKNKKSD